MQTPISHSHIDKDSHILQCLLLCIRHILDGRVEMCHCMFGALGLEPELRLVRQFKDVPHNALTQTLCTQEFAKWAFFLHSQREFSQKRLVHIGNGHEIVPRHFHLIGWNGHDVVDVMLGQLHISKVVHVHVHTIHENAANDKHFGQFGQCNALVDATPTPFSCKHDLRVVEQMNSILVQNECCLVDEKRQRLHRIVHRTCKAHVITLSSRHNALTRLEMNAMRGNVILVSAVIHNVGMCTMQFDSSTQSDLCWCVCETEPSRVCALARSQMAHSWTVLLFQDCLEWFRLRKTYCDDRKQQRQINMATLCAYVIRCEQVYITEPVSFHSNG
jgi:hypothetical protein